MGALRSVYGDRRRQDGRASSGDVENFEAFYQQQITDVVAYLIALTGDRWVAEELAQETFTRAYRDWRVVSGHENPGGWVHRVAHNLAMSRFRRLAAEARASRRLRGMGATATNAEPMPHDEAFWGEVRRLPTRQAQAVTLHYLQDRPVSEIAHVMGCTESTAKVHLHRARRRLAARLRLETDDGAIDETR